MKATKWILYKADLGNQMEGIKYLQHNHPHNISKAYHTIRSGCVLWQLCCQVLLCCVFLLRVFLVGGATMIETQVWEYEETLYVDLLFRHFV